MCGIAGRVDFTRGAPDLDTLQRMTRTLVHRGPDEEGFFLEGPAGLGMRRLSIIDLDTGRQPVFNEDETLVTIFNGEIYNFRELRRRLQGRGHRFRTLGDTETIVHAYEAHGPGFVHHLDGMFAIAVWDRRRRRLSLYRDRLGIKPLYYHVDGQALTFGSEIKAVLAGLSRRPDLDPEAVRAFVALRYVPDPLSIFEGIRKLPPGHRLEFTEAGVRIEEYWDLPLERLRGHTGSISRATSEGDSARRIRSALDRSVRDRLVSDVPLGAFLSGGVDSSAIVSCMARGGGGTVPRTFSIGFDESGFDEREWSSRVADGFGTRHFESVVRPDVLALMEVYSHAFDEPFADPAALPTLVLARETRRHVKVALSGDGSDEIFAGYDRYTNEGLADLYRLIPAGLRAGIESVTHHLVAHIPPNSGWRSLGERALRKAALARLDPRDRYLSHFDTFFGHPTDAIYAPAFCPEPDDPGVVGLLRTWWDRSEGADPLTRRLYLDLKTWLPGQMLTKVDRTSMAASLEVRVPFLAHALVEDAFAIPPEQKLTWLAQKQVLRRAFASDLPIGVATRRKHGFQVPLARWFRGPLESLLGEVLHPRRIEDQGVFRPGFVSRLLDEHRAGHRDHSDRLFSLLVFGLWHDRWVESAGLPAGTSFSPLRG